MFGLGMPELIIILVILLLLFGATRLPKIARSIGQSANELQKGFKSDSKDNQQNSNSSSDSTNNQNNT